MENDLNGASDVFVRGLGGEPTELISRADAQRTSRSGLQSASFGLVSVSDDGNRVAFASFDDPRVPFDTNGQRDVFVQDLPTGLTFAMSVTPESLAPTNGMTHKHILSANGEAVVYLKQTRSTEYYNGAGENQLLWKSLNGGSAQEVDRELSWGWSGGVDRYHAALSPDGQTVVYPVQGHNHLRWKNMITGNTGLVTRTWNNYSPAGPPSHNPVFSHNGRFVAFASQAAFLVSNSTPYFGRHMYVRDMQSNETRILTRDNITLTGLPNTEASAGVFSGNDRYVLFDGIYTTNQERRIYRFDLESGVNGGTLRLVCTNCSNPSVSADGQVVAYNIGNRFFPTNVVVTDLSSGATRLIGRNIYGNTVVPGQFGAPEMRGDGRFIVFATAAGSLVLNDSNGFSDIFVHDRVQRTTMLVSRSRLGPRSASGGSSRPVMAADGRTVVFQSFAGDLVEGDYNERQDIFVVKLGLGDSDNDGMDDDWEVAYFSDLSRDGAGDRDGDQQTDLQEFLAGTDPTNGDSILQVLTVTPMSGGSTTIIWSAVIGRNYVVQYKDSISVVNWSNASGVIQADSSGMSYVHNSVSARRFYRVITIP